MIGEKGPSLPLGINNGIANVASLGGGLLMARVAIIVAIGWSLFLCENCVEFSTR